MGRVARHRLQRGRHHSLHFAVANLAWSSWPGLIEQTLHSTRDETCTPFADRDSTDSEFSGDNLVVQVPICARQYDPRA
jgi:hypothetical protein